jgi:hypothetical protein
VAAITVVVVSILLLDAVRRWVLWSGYKFVNLAILVLSTYLGWRLFRGTWVPAAALTAVVVALLVMLTVVLVNLTFLGAYALFIDRAVRVEGDPAFTREEALDVLTWRRTGEEADRPKDPRVARRARIVFPSAYQPRGPIQTKVSEIFDSDTPPFAKHFLVVTTTAEWLTITPHPVDGVHDLTPLPPINVRLRH